MVAAIRVLSSLFLSVAIVLLGHGLQQTVIPLAGLAAGWSSGAISLLGAAYFLGFISGCLVLPALVRNVGHVRVFTSCVAMLIVVVLSIELWPSLPLWLLLRVITGASMAGLYLIFESWLNERAPAGRRGSVLSIYGFLCVAALALGQLLLLELPDTGLLLIIAMLFALGIVPVALTQAPLPTAPRSIELDLGFAFRASQVGFLCAGFSGLIMGTIWSAGAIDMSERFDDPGAGASFLLAVLLGGLCFQVPIGRLSDRTDRRWVLLGLAAIGLLTCAAWLFVLPQRREVMFAVAFLCGAMAMPMYSVSVAQANDNANGRFLQIASAMLISSGVGSIFGPLLFAGLSARSVGEPLFAILFTAFALSLLWTALRLRLHNAPMSYQEPFQPFPKTTQAVAMLDPRESTGVDAAGAAPDDANA